MRFQILFGLLVIAREVSAKPEVVDSAGPIFAMLLAFSLGMDIIEFIKKVWGDK